VIQYGNELILMPVPAPAGVILSFALPKESIRRKGNPDVTSSCASCFRRELIEGTPCPSITAIHP
jgi:hypothetical protein